MPKRIILIVAAMLMLTLTGCREVQPEEEMPVSADMTRECVVYFSAEDNLVPVSVEEAWSEDTLNMLYAQMCLSDAQLEGTGLSSVLPSDTEIFAKVEDQTATVEVYSPSIDSLTSTQSENIVTAVVNTATQFGGINGVQLVFNGSSERLGSVDISGILSERSINPAYDIGDLNAFQVYYQLGDTDYIIPVTKAAREVTAEVAVNAMMKEPQGKDVKSLFPQGTKLLSAELENGVLTLNFSKEFSNISTSPNEEKKLLTGLFAMLSSLDGVDEISILVEGSPYDISSLTAKPTFGNDIFFGDWAE